MGKRNVRHETDLCSSSSRLVTSCIAGRLQVGSEGNGAPAPAPAPAATAETPARFEAADGDGFGECQRDGEGRAVNYATRRVILEDTAGRSVEIIAGPEIKRLNEVQIGDSVKVEYVASVIAELRAPDGRGVCQSDHDGRGHRALAPGFDTRGAWRDGDARRGDRGVGGCAEHAGHAEGADGRHDDRAGAHHPENIRKLSPGDTIVITYSEGMGISLVKAAAN